ncbi:IS1380 family transposase ISVsp8 [subsurface metagenome]
MKTHCNQKTFEFQAENSRKIVAHFNGGNISSDAGGILLKQAEQATGIIAQFAACFTDHRDPDLIEHTVEELIAQRIYALAMGYEDLNDHDELRNDPLLAVLVGKKDPAGKDRIRKRDRGKALAGKSTLNRLELTPVRANKHSRYKKITADRHAIDDFLINVFLQSYDKPFSPIVLDLEQ